VANRKCHRVKPQWWKVTHGEIYQTAVTPTYPTSHIRRTLVSCYSRLCKGIKTAPVTQETVTEVVRLRLPWLAKFLIKFPNKALYSAIPANRRRNVEITVIAWRPSVALPINPDHLYVVPNKGSELFLCSGQKSRRESSLAHLLGSLDHIQPDSSPSKCNETSCWMF